MKIKVSVSMEKGTMNKVSKKVKESFYRNKSHLIGLATIKYLEEKNDYR